MTSALSSATAAGLPGPGLDDILAQASEIEGLLAAALVEAPSGVVLASVRAGESVDPAVIGAAAADIVHLLGDLVARTGLDDELEDVMVTVTGRHHLVRMLRGAAAEPLALVVTLDRRESNLGMARRELREIALRLDASDKALAAGSPSDG